MWGSRGFSEEPKMADTWGADEIRIDASTAAAVIIRASLFMSLPGEGLPWDCWCFFAEITAIPMISTLAPRAMSGCPAGYKAQHFFPGVQPGECHFSFLGMVMGYQPAISASGAPMD